MKLYVANVGVNSSDASKNGLRSPIFQDGTFEFVPIVEDASFSGSELIPTYSDLPSWTGQYQCLADLFSKKVRRFRTHADPEFHTFTYGDIGSPRAANLAYVQPGDHLWFLARLWNHDGAHWTGAHHFYLIGFIEVKLNLEFQAGIQPVDISVNVRKRIENNAHYKRVLAGDRQWFRVLCGKPRKSSRFKRALKVTTDVAGLLFGGSYDASTGFFKRGKETLKNKNGQPRSFQQFPSITRTIQCFLDSNVPEQQEYMNELNRMARECGRLRSSDRRFGTAYR